MTAIRVLCILLIGVLCVFHRGEGSGILPVQNGARIALKSIKGHQVKAERNQKLTLVAPKGPVILVMHSEGSTDIPEQQIFTITWEDNKKFSLRTFRGSYITAHSDGTVIQEVSSHPSERQLFQVEYHGNKACFKTFKGNYLKANEAKGQMELTYFNSLSSELWDIIVINE